MSQANTRQNRIRQAREVLFGAPIVAIVWLLLIRFFGGAWNTTFPLVVLAFSLVVGLMMAGPERIGKPVFALWKKLISCIDYVVTRVACLILYYGLFTPVGIILRLFRVCLLQQRLFPEKASYWEKSSPRVPGKRHYFRQY
jgi:hypothetical protein